MAFPVTFATLPTGNNPASLFDTMFATVGGMGIVECTATGANTILLSPVANMPTVAAYTALFTASFIAAANNTGACTVNISGIGGVPLIHADGTALVSGDIKTGQAVFIMYDGTASFYLMSATANSFASAANTGFRNWLLNGAFQVWQRGAGGAASIAVAASTVAYTADRWYIATGANQASTVSQQTTGSGFRYNARVQRNAAQTGTGVMRFACPLDSDVIAALASFTCTLSVNVTTGANWSPASGTLNLQVFCGTGAVAKRNATPYTGETTPINLTQNVAAGSGNTTFSGSGVIPTATTQMEVQFNWTPVGTAGANDWFSVITIQLEIGGAATAFDLSRLNFINELAQAQRFFQKSFPYGTAPVQNVGNQNGCLLCTNYNNGAAQNANATTIFRPTLRASPSLTTFNPAVANANWRDTINASDAVVSTLQISDGGMSLQAAAAHSFPDNNFIHWQVDAEI